jgi:hypothetical protein
LENTELNKALCRLLIKIAEREKKKAISLDDYGTALVATIFEGIFKEAEVDIINKHSIGEDFRATYPLF